MSFQFQPGKLYVRELGDREVVIRFELPGEPWTTQEIGVIISSRGYSSEDINVEMVREESEGVAAGKVTHRLATDDDLQRLVSCWVEREITPLEWLEDISQLPGLLPEELERIKLIVAKN